jgi:hypothetical protein
MRQLLLALLGFLAFSVPASAQDSTAVTDNVEMAEILAADQAVRQNVALAIAGGRAYAERIVAEDAVRRERVRVLLEADALSTAVDFHSAAFVFQHGETPEDYLLAHTLALAAIAEGSTESTWIAAASLDRYLQSIGRPQIYGTQTTVRRGERPSRDPYDHQLVPLGLLKAIGVPTRAAEEARRNAAGASSD